MLETMMRLLAAPNSADSGCSRPVARQSSPARATGAAVIPMAAAKAERMRRFMAVLL